MLINQGKISWDPKLFEFFRRNKKSLSSEAEKYFQNRIRENLKNAGKYNYERIAESIHQLKQLNPPLAGKWLDTIRSEYSRRRNLIALLDKY
ncbi:MAG: hypothetical protein ISS19_16785 [Bacteroidales bacterium]|nr:hypothetical protein [Bacteroidales bacterium]